MNRAAVRELFNEAMKGYMVTFAADGAAKEHALPFEDIDTNRLLNGYGMQVGELQLVLASVRASVVDLLDAMGMFDDSGKEEP